MKRFLVFVFEVWYPRGGWSDFEGSYDTFEQAANSIPVRFNPNTQSFQVIDSLTGKEATYESTTT